MTNFLSSMMFVLFFLFSSYGLGRLVAKLVHNEEKIGWAYTSSLGVATWIVYGGVLNFLHIISPLTLRYSLYIGVTLALGFSGLDVIKRSGLKKIKTEALSANDSRVLGHHKVADLFFLLLVIATLNFTVYYLMPSEAYNFHDDFHSYLHPVLQLLSTGGLDFNLLSTLGINEMGGQMFMQTIPSIYFDVQYANTFDSIICFTLGLGLVIEFGRKIGAGNGIIIISSILFLFINPHIVNISSCYSGTLMILGIMYTSYSLNKKLLQSNNNSFIDIVTSVIPISIFYCSIVTLKSTFIIFVCSFFILNFLFDIFFQNSKKLVIKTNLTISIVSLFLLAPWLMAPSSKYLYTLQSMLMSKWMGLQSNTPPALHTPPTTANNFPSLFSTGDLFWGNSYPDYIAILTALLFAAVFSLYGLSRTTSSRVGKETTPIPAGAISVILSLFIFCRIIDIESALRYAIPILIAILPLSTLFVGTYFIHGAHAILKSCGCALLALHLMIGGMFVGTFIDRVKRVSTQRTLLSFPISDQYRDFMRFVFGGEREKQIRSVQSYIEPGEHVLAWISTPFYLDFARNKITTFEVCSTMGRAYKDQIPINVDITTFWNFFRKLGIRYILWEYEGPAVKNDQWYIKNKAPELFFKDTLPILANYTKVIYNKDSIAVLDISELHLNTPNIPTKK